MFHNRVNREELRERMRASQEARRTLSFYRYFRIDRPAEFRHDLYRDWSALGVFGRIYVAQEGINGQISVPETNYAAWRAHLDVTPGLANLRLNHAIEDDGKSFYKLTIKVRPKIVADGLNDAAFDPADGGTHLDARQFNALTERDDCVVVDMRNNYESEVGHFRDALTPNVATFRESLPLIEELLDDHRDQPVVMYCTGGIRCEKASAWFKHRGFRQVYQLDGGIIEYTRTAEREGLENKFVGKNFVFDERMGERISNEVISSCHQCGRPSDRHVNCANDHCHLLFLQCETCAVELDGCCTEDCREHRALPEAERAAVAKSREFMGKRYPNARYFPGGPGGSLRRAGSPPTSALPTDEGRVPVSVSLKQHPAH